MFDSSQDTLVFREPFYVLTVREPKELLRRLLDRFKDNAAMSLEGDFEFQNTGLVGVTTQETNALSRSTWQAWQDGIPYTHTFVVIPLDETNRKLLERQIVESLDPAGNLWHVQIALGDELIFGAYDNFMAESVVLKPVVETEWLGQLQRDGILDSFRMRAKQ